MPIIDSLLDTDFYKFTMMQAIFHKYTKTHVKYKFKWRNHHQSVLDKEMYKKLISIVSREVDHLCNLRFAKEELEYLRSIRFISDDFIEFLRLFQLNRDYITINEDYITVEGPWLNTILFETPVLAIISEVYTLLTEHIKSIDHVVEGERILREKAVWLDHNAPMSFVFGDFSTRRRASKDFQERMLKEFIKQKRLTGTSNVHFAMKLGINPLGTQAHEWFQVHQQLGSRLVDSQKAALQAWSDEYRGDLGIALSDCITFDAFLVDFDRYFAKLFDGCRHDSGNPYEWADKLIAHYRDMGIEPRTKTALFSDGLNFVNAVDLYKKYKNEIITAFGIGTYLGNDCGFVPPQIVMKVVECNGLPVAKISDSPGKGMCEDISFENYLKKIILQKQRVGNNV